MSNWGSIYTSTWWGEGIYNTIGWGSAYPAAATANVIDFRDRVEADGGSVEALACLGAAINRLPQADSGRVIWDAYSVRVLADSGILEGRDCTINEINEIN